MMLWRRGKYLSLIAVMPTLVTAAVCKKPVSVDGHLRLRAEYLGPRTAYVNGSVGTATDSMNMRARTKMEFCSDNDASVVFEPQAYKVFGGDNNTENYNGTAHSNVMDGALGIHQAYVDTEVTESLTFRGGRQILNYGDGMVIGADEFYNGRTFDALLASYKLSMGKIDFLYAKPVDTDIKINKDNVNLMGVYTSWNLHDWAKEFDLYYLMNNDHREANATRTFIAAGIQSDEQPKTSIYGLRLKSDMHDFDYRLEATFQNTKRKINKSLSGSHIDAAVGYTFTNAYNFRIGAEYFNANEEFRPDYMYYSANDYLGDVGLFNRHNIKGYSFQVSIMPMEELTLAIVYQNFALVKKGTYTYNLAGGSTATGASYQAMDAKGNFYNSADTTTDKLGSEWDFRAMYAISPKSELNFSYGIFTPDTYFKNYGYSSSQDRSYFDNTKAVSYTYLQYVVHF